MGIEPKRILVIQTAFLGDVVLTTPFLKTLRDRFPSAYLAALVIPGTREILENSVLDDLLTYDKKGRDRSFWPMVRRLREKSFDTCFLLHRSFRSALLAWAAGIPRRIGYLRTLGGVFYTHRVPWDKSRHEVDRSLELLSPVGIDPSSVSANLSVSPRQEDMDEIERLMIANGIRRHDRIIVIAPGSVWATKRWIPRGFGEVIDRLVRMDKAKLVLVGSQDDLSIVEDITRHCQEKVVNLCGKTSLLQLAALLKRSHLLITNDNGAMHIGAAQGVPIVAIFGSTTLDLGYGPYTKRVSVVEHSLGCRPCGKHGYVRCPLGHFDCMRGIAPDEVLEASEKYLC